MTVDLSDDETIVLDWITIQDFHAEPLKDIEDTGLTSRRATDAARSNARLIP